MTDIAKIKQAELDFYLSIDRYRKKVKDWAWATTTEYILERTPDLEPAKILEDGALDD